MFCSRIELDHFRNHQEMTFHWAPGVNLLSGPNGAGKTNAIDAIHYLCMSRSFVTASDQFVAHHGRTAFSLRGVFGGDIRSEFTLSCTYARGDGKTFFVNDSPLDRLADLIGRVPVVVLSPEDRKLTGEGPDERRSFIDALISQASSSYLHDLMEYRRVVRQRNRILIAWALHRTPIGASLDAWDDALVRTGTRILTKRKTILAEFESYMAAEYEFMAGVGHHPTFKYKSSVEDEADFTEKLAAIRPKEMERGMTLIGPHRDDLVFYLDGIELRRFGSQGQHRLFAFALKLAQRRFYAEQLEDQPIFLLDDVFGDLDPGKIATLLRMLDEQNGQAFITAANPQPLTNVLDFDGRHRHFTFHAK